MRKLFTFLLLSFFFQQGMAQTNPLVQQVINNVNIDSLTQFVNELSGEVPVIINGQPVTITSRYYNTSTNDKAADYLKQKFDAYGLQTFDQTFSYGRNVYGIQTGAVYPDQYFIICAHYDDMPSSGLAPGADDNGSGTCAVIEAARVLKDYTFDYSIIYAVWDAEELGLLGSAYYAQNTTLNILGVINMDMIAWDSNNDNLAEIHTRNIANSVALKDSMLMVNTDYSVGIQPSVINPGITASDHASFWNQGITAVLLIENYYGDFNQYYHTSNDLIDHYNFPYFEKCSKLCIGTLSLMANVEGIVPVELTSFTADWQNENVSLAWNTATELNNYGFGIEKKTENSAWHSIGFVAGNGTKQTPTSYTFTDPEISSTGKCFYRLKQIDNDGSFIYSSVVEITLAPSDGFVLEQNYPNPFNPTTKIRFSLPESSTLRLSIYNVVGEEVAVLAEGYYQAGHHELTFSSTNLPSGVYLYKLQYRGSVQMKKMLLLE